MKYIKLILLSSLLLCFNSYAGDPWCKGKITGIYIQSDGNLYITYDFRKEWVMVCNIDSSWKNVSSETCKAWYSLALSSKVSQVSVATRYRENEVTSCSTIPSYSNAPSPKYIMKLQN